MRNTSIRTRKMRGEDSLKGSRSRAMAGFIEPKLGCKYGTVAGGGHYRDAWSDTSELNPLRCHKRAVLLAISIRKALSFANRMHADAAHAADDESRWMGSPADQPTDVKSDSN